MRLSHSLIEESVVTTEMDQPAPAPRRPAKAWVPPVLERLPKLTDLTLTSSAFGDPIDGGPTAF